MQLHGRGQMGRPQCARVRPSTHNVPGPLLVRLSAAATSAPETAPESATASVQPQAKTSKEWADKFSGLNDRRSQAPLPLPNITQERLVTIVRHGESTWNAESRVQGSSDFSELTEKGMRQALATRDMLAPMSFTQMWYSPLERAARTAEVVWGERVEPRHCDPVLREIDLYSFQGLEKSEVKRAFGNQYLNWQQHPEDFEIDGHYPVFESWHRASMAWRKVLTSETDRQPWHSLIVAHNNTNQALIATALQLPVTFFRRLTQAVLMCLNQSTLNPLKPQSKVVARLVLVLPHTQDEECNAATADLIAEAPVRRIVMLPSVSDGVASQAPLARLLSTQCKTATGEEPDVTSLMQEAGNEAWQSLLALASEDNGSTVVVLLDSTSVAGLTCSAFGLGQMARHKFKFEPGSISVFDFTGLPAATPAVARCLNNRAHLPRAAPPAVPISVDGTMSE